MEDTSLVQMAERLEWLEGDFFSSINLSLVIFQDLILDFSSVPRSSAANEFSVDFLSPGFFRRSVEMRIVDPVTFSILSLEFVVQELLDFFRSEASVERLEVLAKIQRKKE